VAGTVLYDREGHVATITYNRPDARNAINAELRQDLNAAWERFRDDEDAWIGIVTGAGDSFCAGADMKEPGGSAGTWPGSFWEVPTINSYESGLEVWKPTIAAVNGHCLGYGLTLVTRCDFVIAADDAQFGFPEVRLGVPTIVGALRLPDRVGWSNAMELLLTGDRFDASHAHEIGLAWKVVPRHELMAEARSLADRLLRLLRSPRGPRRRSPRAAGICPGQKRSGSGRPCVAWPPIPKTPPRAWPRRASAVGRSGRAAERYYAGVTR
jgi:enoyl-CoA hydratase/carnithine racemase